MRRIRLTAIVAAFLALQAAAVFGSDSDICEKESGDIAIRACDRAIASGKLTKGQLAWAYHNRGVEYEIKNEHEKAKADYNQALRIDANRSGSLVGRGNAFSNLGDYERAIADYNTALRIDSKDVNAYYNRGLAYERKGDIQLARSDYEQALAMPATSAKHRSAQERARENLRNLPK